MTDIFVVDDHEFYRKGLVLTISRFKDMQVTGEAANGKELLEHLKNSAVLPDIVLTDIKMPEMDGIEATQKAMQEYKQLKVIALSMFGEEEYLESMLEAGAQGFLLKNIGKEGLKRALDKISQGQQYFSEELLPYFTKKYIGKDTTDDTGLTKREVEVLQLVSEGLSNKEIADRLFISLRTVNFHRANLNMKTGSKNTAGLLAYAIKNNLVDIS
jgi:DNA-binding NarL/FixJ family response regulator